MAPLEQSELIAMLASIVVGCIVWGRWLVRVMGVDPLVARPGGTWAVPSAIGSFTIINFVVLRTLAASDVRSRPAYVLFYLGLGLGVSAVALKGIGLFGVRPADISQRGNLAAATFVLLATIAAAFAYAGANIGEGPGFHVVLFCTVLSYGALLAIMSLHAAFGHTAYHVLVEHDIGTALRAGGMLIACGICLGRAVAGDWTGSQAAVADFVRHGWPAAALCGVDLAVARIAFKQPDRAVAGAALAIVYIGLAVAYVVVIGIPA
jgi:hypothetical protein